MKKPPAPARPSQDPVERLVKGELRDPHSFLGQHPQGAGSVLRAWRPEAETVAVVSNGEVIAKLEQVHPRGLFEGTLDSFVDDYQLEVTYPNGQSFTLRDPYSFLPTLGDIDL